LLALEDGGGYGSWRPMVVMGAGGRWWGWRSVARASWGSKPMAEKEDSGAGLVKMEADVARDGGG
jgi:hypothetical protein